MKRRKSLLLLLLSLAVIALLSPSEFWAGELIPVDSFNRKVARVHDWGDNQWTESATCVAREFVGDRETVEPRNLSVDSKLTCFSLAVVTIVVEGYQDDSIAGSRYRLRMKKVDGYWQIQSAYRQWKCQPGRGHTWWSCGTCS